MAKSIHYIVFYLLISFPSFSQNNFKGKVVSEETNLPVEKASVYFNNTSRGTTSDSSGEFSIDVTGVGNIDLIISSVGYEIIAYKINPADNLQNLYLFKLKPKKIILQNVLLVSDATRKKYLKYFVDNFLGLTEEASNSSIQNLSAIYFTKNENENSSFNAHSDTILVIINKMLGYKLYFQLFDFYYNEATGTSSFYGYTRYEDLGDDKKWLKNRRKAYYGSSLHFFRSLIGNTLEKESYKIFIVREDTIKTAEGYRANSVAIPAKANQVVKIDSADTSKYIGTWQKKLMVQYTKNPASKSYLSHRVFISDPVHTGFRSYLIINEPPVEIDSSGILLNPLSVFFSGYWVYEKAANLLPYNYYPEPEK